MKFPSRGSKVKDTIGVQLLFYGKSFELSKIHCLTSIKYLTEIASYEFCPFLVVLALQNEEYILLRRLYLFFVKCSSVLRLFLESLDRRFSRL